MDSFYFTLYLLRRTAVYLILKVLPLPQLYPHVYDRYKECVFEVKDSGNELPQNAPCCVALERVPS